MYAGILFYASPASWVLYNNRKLLIDLRAASHGSFSVWLCQQSWQEHYILRFSALPDEDRTADRTAH